MDPRGGQVLLYRKEMHMQIESTSRPAPAKSSGALPGFFRAHVLQARASRTGYEEAGCHLAIHVRQILEGDVDDDVLDQLDAILANRTAAVGVMWEWFRATLPRCMALVPSRRKATFLRGVQSAIDEERV